MQCPTVPTPVYKYQLVTGINKKLLKKGGLMVGSDSVLTN